MLKRGEGLSAGMIVLIVLAIGGLIIGLLFFTGIWEIGKTQNSKEICKLSILKRATVPAAFEDYFPLECTPEKVCLTVRGGFFGTAAAVTGLATDEFECKQFLGEDNVRPVYVGLPKDKGDLQDYEDAKKLIETETANAMYDCWSMTGEGKLDIFTKSGDSKSFAVDIAKLAFEGATTNVFDAAKPRCVICSRIAFSDALINADKDLKERTGTGVLEQIDVNAFIAREKVPPGNTLTYLQTFTDRTVGGYGEFGQQEIDYIRKAENTLQDATQFALIFMQIKVTNERVDNVGWSAFGNNMLLGGAGVMAATGSPLSGGLTGVLVKLGAVGTVSAGLAYNTYLNVEKSQAISAASCGDLETTLTDHRRGCSIVRPVMWNVDTLNSICQGGVEGNL